MFEASKEKDIKMVYPHLGLPTLTITESIATMSPKVYVMCYWEIWSYMSVIGLGILYLFVLCNSNANIKHINNILYCFMKFCVWSATIYKKGGLNTRPQHKSQSIYKEKLNIIVIGMVLWWMIFLVISVQDILPVWLSEL